MLLFAVQFLLLREILNVWPSSVGKDVRVIVYYELIEHMQTFLFLE